VLRLVELFDKRKPRGGDRNSEEAKSKTSQEVIDPGKELSAPPASRPGGHGSSANDTAKILGVGRATVERARTIIDHGTEELKEKVRTGVVSIKRGAEITVLLQGFLIMRFSVHGKRWAGSRRLHVLSSFIFFYSLLKMG
jgi:hypothetical protein